MAEINYVERYRGENSETYLLKMETENALEKAGFSEADIEKISDRVGKANGYAYLTEIEISRKNYPKALNLVKRGLLFDYNSVWLMRLYVQLLRRLSPDDHDAIGEILDDYLAISIEAFDIELSFELAKETYMSGKIGEARFLFNTLFSKAKHHPRRYIPRETIDRWVVNGAPMRINGTIVRAPTEDRYGLLRTTFPATHSDNLVVRLKDMQYDVPPPRIGDRVSYELVFNMRGPEASRIRRI